MALLGLASPSSNFSPARVHNNPLRATHVARGLIPSAGCRARIAISGASNLDLDAIHWTTQPANPGVW
jgi:hypothetical protein